MASYVNLDLHLDWSPLDGLRHGQVVLTYNNHSFIPVEYDGRQEPLKTLVSSPGSAKPEEWHQEAGKALANLFFPAESPLRATLKNHERVRLRLIYPPDDDKTKALLDIPWEYLYIDDLNSELKTKGFVCFQPGFSLVHCLTNAKNAGSAQTEPLPIQVALLYSVSPTSGSNESTETFSDVTEDLKQRNAESIIRLVTLLKADDVDVVTKLKHSHVVQILSHGQPAALNVANGTMTLPEMTSLLDYLKVDENRRQLKAVVLCACQVGVEPAGVAAQLHKLGVPMVIGMTRTIIADTARLFMKVFYSELAEGNFDLESVLAFSRLHLFQSNWADPQNRNLEWGLPRLYLNSEDSNVISGEQLYRPFFNVIDRFESLINRTQKKTISKPAPTTLQQQFETWLSGDRPILYVKGFSGSGKSTEIARLLIKHPELVRHICAEPGKEADSITNDPLAFCRDSLYPQLEKFYGSAFRDGLSKGVYPITAHEANEAFCDLIVNPLKEARRRTGKRPVIVIDGLDNAVESSSRYSILDLLIDQRDNLLEGTRLIITADADSDADKRIQDFLVGPNDILAIPPVQVSQLWTELTADEKIGPLLAASPQLSAWMSQEAGQAQPDLGRLIPRQAGRFINNAIVGLDPLATIDLLGRMGETLIKQSVVDATASLDSYYEAYLSYLVTKNTTQKMLLQVLAVAYRPLSAETLSRLVGDDSSVLLKSAAGFVEESADGWSCEHPSIRRFLARQLDVGEAHSAFVKMFRRQCGKAEWQQTADSDWARLPEPDQEYARRYLAMHAYERYKNAAGQAARSEQASDFLALVTAPGFREFCFGGNDFARDAREQIRLALQVVLIEEIGRATLQVSQTAPALESLLGTFESRNYLPLMKLERKLRCNHGGVDALKEFLGLVNLAM